MIHFEVIIVLIRGHFKYVALHYFNKSLLVRGETRFSLPFHDFHSKKLTHNVINSVQEFWEKLKHAARGYKPLAPLVSNIHRGAVSFYEHFKISFSQAAPRLSNYTCK